MNAEDAAALRAAEGDWVRITSRRGSIEVPVRLGGIERGRVFVPFHYGYWDDPERARAANELTILEWDEVSKQPHYKYAAVSITCIDAPSTTQPDEEVSKAPALPLFAWIMPPGERAGGAGRSWRDHTSAA